MVTVNDILTYLAFGMSSILFVLKVIVYIRESRDLARNIGSPQLHGFHDSTLHVLSSPDRGREGTRFSTEMEFENEGRETIYIKDIHGTIPERDTTLQFKNSYRTVGGEFERIEFGGTEWDTVSLSATDEEITYYQSLSEQVVEVTVETSQGDFIRDVTFEQQELDTSNFEIIR